MSYLGAYGPLWWVIGIAIVVVLLAVVGRRMSGGANIVEQLPPDKGVDIKPGEQPDIGPESQGQNRPPGS